MIHGAWGITWLAGRVRWAINRLTTVPLTEDKNFKRSFGVSPVPRATVGRVGGVREPPRAVRRRPLLS